MAGHQQSIIRVSSWEGFTLPGGVQVGPPVARGGFGVVHRGRVEPGGVDVALKILLGASDPERVQSFVAEMSLLAGLRHPAIAGIVASGVWHEGGVARPWMAVEWCDGWTMASELLRRAGKRHTRAEAWELFGPVLDAVAYAHASGCVHRDLKPANVMLVPDARVPGKLHPRVIDWGIGKRVDAEVSAGSGDTGTLSNLLAFTEAYAAPEQVAATRTGPWTDVHALGLMLTELLVGERPYGGEGGLAAIVDPTRPTPRTFGVDVGPWEAVLARAMSLRVGERYRTAGDLAAALRACDASLPPPTPAVSSASPPPSSIAGNAIAGSAPGSPIPNYAAAGAIPAYAPGATPARSTPTWALALVASVGALALGAGLALLLLPDRRPRREAAEARPAPAETAVDPERPVAPAPSTKPRAAARGRERAAHASGAIATPPKAVRALASLDALDDDAVLERGAAAGFTRLGTPPKHMTAPISATHILQGPSGSGMVTVHRPGRSAGVDSYWRTMCSKPDSVCARGGGTVVWATGEARVALRDAVVAGIPCTKTPR